MNLTILLILLFLLVLLLLSGWLYYRILKSRKETERTERLLEVAKRVTETKPEQNPAAAQELLQIAKGNPPDTPTRKTHLEPRKKAS